MSIQISIKIREALLKWQPFVSEKFIANTNKLISMVESKDEVPSTPQATNGEPVNWADLVDYEETKASIKSGNFSNVIPILKPNEQSIQIDYNSDGDKVEVEYRINPDTNKKEKVSFQLSFFSRLW